MMDRLYERRLLKNKTKIAFFTVNVVILEKFKFLIKRYKAILNFKSEIIFKIIIIIIIKQFIKTIIKLNF